MQSAIQLNDFTDAIEALKKMRRKNRIKEQNCDHVEAGPNYFLVGGPYPNYAKK